MPPKKGLGGAKGKGKAPRTQAKRVRHRDDSSDEELDPQVAALIAKVQALERSRGVAVSAPAVNPQTTGVRQHHTRRQTQADLLQSLAARIEAIEPQRPQLTEQSPLPDQAGTCDINEDVPSGPQTQTASDGIQPAAPIPTAPNAGSALPRPGTLGASAAGTHAPIPMGHWQLEIERAVWQSIAPSTRASYQRAGKEFHAFRAAKRLAIVWPIPVDHILQFCVFSYAKGLSARTIAGKLAALAFLAKMQGVPDSTSDFRVRQALKGWSKASPQPQDNRLPITPDILARFKSQWLFLCHSPYEAALFHAVAVTAFFGAFRISELLACSKNDRSCTALQYHDLALFDHGVTLRLRRSKTDQEGRGACISLNRAQITDICPVSALHTFANLRGDREGYLFCHSDSAPLTKYQFWSITKTALQTLGLQATSYGTHSFRIGAASTAASLQLPQQTIQSIGRWKSAAFQSYVRKMS
ncbi:uncharacterized protein LOC134392912 [Elgaria multicarinata webbii]|uniref:uncharacterized protein LOC134392912 n=1 Tax=Elgaria multicarinata webbii TaxID=159646 RepID=UPI002FCCFAC4